MIDYELTQNEKKLQQDLATFCQREIAPAAAGLDQAPRKEVGVLVRKNIEKLANAGFLAVGFEDNTIDMICQYIAAEEIAKVCASTFFSARASAFLCGGLISLYGTAQQKEKYLESLKLAKVIGAFAYTEPGAGSDISGIETTAGSQGYAWLINGVKDTVTNAPIADMFLVLAYTDINAGPEKGLSLFIVEKDTAGLSIGEPLDTMGMRGVPIAQVELNQCKSGQILGGEPGKGFMQLSRILEMGRVSIAGMCVGIGSACMEKATQHAKTRKAFGREIGKYQEVGFKLADMYTNNDLGRALALRAAWAFNTEENEAEILASCAKVFAGEGLSKIANLAMQVFAGHGYIKGADIERLFRDAKIGEVIEGTTEVQRMLIAKSELDKFAQA
ncbi:MAG: acyl-CoA dehydrogenase family protein [Deltaproteobacteria bacterium]|nr:acyl-CoA dehydrogenase family protein [Deltaproteobacteria bacterium]